ncbi:MAG: hypothetical protein ACRDOX_11645 [Nocardioides sp.]
MTRSDDPLTPAEEEVRRLLADARHTGPTPPDVVARLDRVLGDLGQEPDRAAPVVDLARRRRRVASLLVAAAAVVAVGVGIGQVVAPQPASENSEAGASRESADEPRDSVQSKGPLAQNSGEVPTPVTGDAQEKAGLPRLRLDHLKEDFTVARRELASDAQAYSGPGSAARAAGAACAADSWGKGRFVPVSYGGTPAVLVFRRTVGDTQVADLFLCGSEEPVRSVTLPAP